MSTPSVPPINPQPGSNTPGKDGLETYNTVAETVGMMPSLRLKDNVIQAIVVAIGAIIGAIVGYMYMQGLGAIFGALAGIAVFGVLSGIVLMVLGWIRALKK